MIIWNYTVNATRIPPVNVCCWKPKLIVFVDHMVMTHLINCCFISHFLLPASPTHRPTTTTRTTTGFLHSNRAAARSFLCSWAFTSLPSSGNRRPDHLENPRGSFRVASSQAEQGGFFGGWEDITRKGKACWALEGRREEGMV